ncbi:MAG: PQQ-binding-like beta-propeller repeat protein [Cyanobacteria bacterium SZAS LIN-5]|nr:PQQ-binding-like beta-propeller repeat protein [Cyanobacteria bacterium SZAS LIN-5]
MAVIFSRGDKLENGHYTVVKELGVGGMGVVYHCRDEQLMRDVAIKMLLPELMTDKSNVEIFRQEARLAAQLEHPNIVTVYEIGVEERQKKQHHYVSMEYLPGGNLANRVVSGPLAVEHCLNWMKQLASGLTFAHKRGVIHQDIKADNIFITTEGDLKIGDFGLARLLVGRVHYNSATKGMGTPAYMSPELCRGEPQDHRSDIYSLGVLFFEMATGQLPFRAGGMIEMATKHSSAPIPSAKRINPLIPDILDKVIRRMMAKTPEERYSNMSEVLTILDDLIFELRVARLGLGNRPLLRSGPVQVDPLLQQQFIQAKSAEVETSASLSPVTALDGTWARSPGDVARSEPQNLRLPEVAEVRTGQSNLPRSESEELMAQLESSVAEQARLEKLTGKPHTEPVRQPRKQTDFVVSQRISKQPNSSNISAAPIDQRRVDQPGTNAPVVNAAKEPTSASKNTHGQPDFNQPSGKTPLAAPRSGAPPVTPSQAAPVSAGAPPTIPSVTQPRISSSGLKAVPAGALRAPIDQIWTFKTRGPIGWSSSPVIDKDNRIIYCASSDCHVYALDANSGELIWKYDSGGPILSSPVISGDRISVFNATGKVVTLSAKTGAKAWSFSCEDELLTTAVSYKDCLIVPTAKGRLVCLDQASGIIRWQQQMNEPIVSAPQRHADLLLFGTKSGYFHAVSADNGKSIWTFETASAIVASPAASVDSVYFGTSNGVFYALEADNGNLIWEYPTDKPVVSRAVIAFTSVIFASHDKWLYCCEKYDGSLKWKGAVRGKVIANLIVYKDLVLSASHEGWLQAFSSKTGEIKWQKDTERCLESAPLVVNDKLYMGSVEGELAAYSFHDV